MILRDLINRNLALGKIRYFGEEEWDKIRKQNFSLPYPNSNIHDFYDVFKYGGNEGNCTGISKQLCFSYDDVSIVGGVLPILIGTRNCPEGNHTWLETRTKIIEPTFLLVIDIDLKDELGYITENICTQSMLNNDRSYRVRKDYVNDSSIKKNSRRH